MSRKRAPQPQIRDSAHRLGGDDERLVTALLDLGFGRGGVFAVHGTDALDADADAAVAVDVRVGTSADLDSIAALSQVEFLHRSAPPMYAFDQTRTSAEARAAHERLIHDGAIHLVGSRAGRDVGLLTIEPTTPAPRLCATGAPYIGPTATDPGARRSGVGRALVAASLDWARSHGHETISVGFDSRNPRSRPFWLGNGFHPTGCRLRRVLGH